MKIPIKLSFKIPKGEKFTTTYMVQNALRSNHPNKVKKINNTSETLNNYGQLKSYLKKNKSLFRKIMEDTFKPNEEIKINNKFTFEHTQNGQLILSTKIEFITNKFPTTNTNKKYIKDKVVSLINKYNHPIIWNQENTINLIKWSQLVTGILNTRGSKINQNIKNTHKITTYKFKLNLLNSLEFIN